MKAVAHRGPRRTARPAVVRANEMTAQVGLQQALRLREPHEHWAGPRNQMTASLSSPLALALLEEKDAHGTAVHDRLRTMGHQLATFAGTAELLAALKCGQRFDMLLLASPDETTRGSLQAVCEVLGMPMLTVAPGEHWQGLLPWTEELPRRSRAAPWPGDSLAREAKTADTVQGAYRFVEASRTVLVRGQEIYLPPRSFAFALALFRNVDAVLTREWLWNSVWKAPPERAVGRVIDVCAASVRKKLALSTENGFVLNAVYGRGYKLVTIAPEHRTPAGGPAAH